MLLCRYLTHRRGAALLVALAIVLAFVSCGRVGDKDVWATVNGAPITRAQVEEAYRARQTMLPGPSKPEQALSFYLTILNQLIDRKLLLDRAAELQITVSDQEVHARLAAMRAAYPGDVFKQHVKAEGLTPAGLRKQVRDDLTIRKLAQKAILSQVTVSTDEIARYYEHNKADFDEKQTKYHLADILVTPVPDPEIRNLMHDDARNGPEALRKIKALYAQVLSGKDFAKIAADYSEDPRTAPDGGEMGFIPASSLASRPALIRTLNFLQPGQITGIIHDKTGYHIYKLLGRMNAGQRPLSDPGVEKSIRKTLTDEKQEALKAAYIETLRNHAHIVNYLAQQIIENRGSAAGIVTASSP